MLIIILIAYITLLLVVSYLTGRKSDSNVVFFRGSQRTPWYVVAIGMIGTSISGVSLVSVPGMVRSIGFSYMQMVLGFFAGYIVIATVLLPLYYKLNLITIYEYLKKRFGNYSYKTGASFFLLSRTFLSAFRLYIAAFLLQNFLFEAWGIPFAVTVSGILFFIFLYTFRGGVKTIIWTDTLQTLILITTLILIIFQINTQLSTSISETFSILKDNSLTRVFVFDDWASKQNFFKQFISGMFITIVMTGLDQDMMQKNLSCKNLKEAQKNMFSYGFMFIPVNLLFLSIGALLTLLAMQQNIALPGNPDQILPMFANGRLGEWVYILFFIGIMSVSLSSSDSALTALTTSFSVDILGIDLRKSQKAKRTRILVHAAISITIILLILFIKMTGENNSVIDTLYRVVSYTYGPLLGLFAFGMFTKWKAKDKLVPFIAMFSLVIIAMLDFGFAYFFKYKFGYELLILNGLITFAGLYLISNCSIFNEKMNN